MNVGYIQLTAQGIVEDIAVHNVEIGTVEASEQTGDKALVRLVLGTGDPVVLRRCTILDPELAEQLGEALIEEARKALHKPNLQIVRNPSQVSEVAAQAGKVRELRQGA